MKTRDKRNDNFQELAKRVAELENELTETKWLSEKEKLTKRENWLPFYGDITKLNTERTILDTVGKETLRTLTSELMDLLDTSVAIYERNGDYAFGIFNSGWCRLLDSSSRKLCHTDDNKIALNCRKWLCHDDCWNNSAKVAIESQSSTDIDCVGGVKLYSEPIFVGDEVVGAINIGYGNPPTDDNTLKELAKKYQIEFETIKQNALDYNPRPEFIIVIARKWLKSIAKLIGEIVSHKMVEAELTIAKEEAEESEIRFKSVFDNSQDAIGISDENGINVFFNKAYIELFGYNSQDEIVGKSILEQIAPSERDRIKEYGKKRNAGEKVQQIYETIGLKDGTEFPFEINVGRYALHGRSYTISIIRDLTNRRKTEQGIADNKKEFQTWIQNTPVCTKKINLDFNLEFMSEAGIRELKVEDVNKLYGAPYPFNFFPEDFQKLMLDKMKEVRASCEIMQIDGILSDTEGNRMWYNHILVPVNNNKGELDYILIISTDISERKRAESQLIKEKENAEIQNTKIEHFFKAAKAVLNFDDFTTAAKRIFESCKQLTGATSGYVALLNEKGEENEVLFLDSGGLPCTVNENLPMPIRGLRGIAYKLSKAVYHNDFMNSEHIKYMPKGHVVLKNVIFAPLIINKKAVGLIGLANKPTDFNESDLEVMSTFGELASISLRNSRNYEALVKAKQKAEESDQLKSAFLQNISHEIRTPLNAICGFSSRLNKPTLSEDKRNSFVSIIQTSSNQLLSIVNDILTVSSLETQQEKVKIEPVCINNLIIELLSVFKQQAMNQNISLYAKQPLNDKKSEIYTDKTKVTQVLNNLISNAFKFTHEGFVEFGYKLVNTKNQTAQHELVFYVKDSGIGIKPEFQNVIFERFQQADDKIQQNYGGTGLGLSISKGFAELLDGRIWLDSEIDKGATFYFAIPYKPVNEDRITSAENDKPVILVAEDEEFNFLYIEELLIDFNYKLIHAKDGKEAVEIANGQEIGLILMDIKMPVMDGHTAAKIIKKIKPNIPIVAQSAYGLEHEIEKYSDIFEDYLAKPIEENVLVEKVNKYMIYK